MYTCPHCGEIAMSWKTKIALGPGRDVACRECGKPVSVTWNGTAVAMIPFVIGIFIGGIVPVVIGTLAAIPIQLFWVPLVAR
jgi:hypothetical protein